MKKSASELRFDIVSKDWVVIVTGRARRPASFKKEKRVAERASQKDCPFCHLETQEPPVFEIKEKGKLKLAVIPNKYPAFSKGEKLNQRAVGPYQVIDGVGFHEVFVTADHDRHLAQFSQEEMGEVIYAYRHRYLALMNREFVNYISIFHNHGVEAGASIYHPHSQLIAMPTTDPDLERSIRGSRRFEESSQKCVHCTMLEWDRQEGKRIIYENENFVVLCPFASRVAFEVRIYPKKHKPYFEQVPDQEIEKLADALGAALRTLYKGLNNPPYNFFIHTAPCDKKAHDHYHWHFEILPKTAIWAGFELGTGIEISTIEPEKAAEFLRKQI